MRVSLFVFLIASISPLNAQRSEKWLRENDIGNFHEGTYSREVGNSTMKLISLVAHWQPYQFYQNQNQKVRFFSPEEHTFFLKVEELSVRKYYWLQNKPNKLAKDWYEFDGWLVDRWLRRLKLPYSSLGATVQIGAKNERLFLPAWIYHGPEVPETNRYVAQIRSGIGFEGGRYEIYRGSDKKGANSLMRKELLPGYGGNCFPLVIPIEVLPSSDWYLVVINVIERGSKDPHTFSFKFYHR